MNNDAITVSDYIIKRLIELKINCIFMLPGGGCMYLVDALARQNQIEVIPLLHEQSVGIAAEAYSQYSGKLGVSLVTTGPGGTNAVTACAAAWTDSTPMLFISGQVKSSDIGSKLGVRQLGFQELPITKIVAPITKKSVLLERPEEIHTVLDDLVFSAQSGRPGPVWLDIPLDIQNQVLNISKVINFNTSVPENKYLVNEIQQLVSLLLSSKKPLFLIGNGIRLSGMMENMEEFLSRCKIPTLLTWKMIDFLDEQHELNAGRPGAIAQPWSNFVQEESDLIICLGARIDTGQSAYNLFSFGQNGIKYIVDIDETELNKFPNSTNYIKLNVDLKSFLPIFQNTFLGAASSVNVGKWDSWLKEVAFLKSKYQHSITDKTSNGNSVNLYKFVKVLSDQLSNSAILVPGSSGACSEVIMQAFQVKKGQRIFNSEGLGPMGFGIPAALGACIASGRRQVISVDGDGGFLMNIQELASVKLHADHIIFFVLNNNGYGSIKLTQDKLFSGRRLGTDPSTGLALLNLSKIANAFEIPYVRIDREDTLETDIKQILSSENSVIVEIFVDPNHKTLPRVRMLRDASGNPLASDMRVMDF